MFAQALRFELVSLVKIKPITQKAVLNNEYKNFIFSILELKFTNE